MTDKWVGVCRFGGIGDNLIVSSVFPALRAKYGRLEVITRKPNHVVFENNPFVDRLIAWPEDEAPTDAVTWQKRVAARGLECDAFFHLSHTCETELVLVAGQTKFYASDEVRRRACGQSYLSYVHDYCGLSHDDFAPGFYPTQAETDQALETMVKIRSAGRPGGRLPPVIGWCLSGSRVDKLYPYSGYVIARLIRELGASVIMFGAPNKRDAELSKAIHEQVKVTNSAETGLWRAVSDDVGEWPIRRILTQAQQCDLVISVDTGPAWAVAMLDMPKVILVSHASVKNITFGWNNTITLHADQGRVPCWPCHRLHDDFSTCVKADGLEAAACMADISVESVVQAVHRGLAGPR